MKTSNSIHSHRTIGLIFSALLLATSALSQNVVRYKAVPLAGKVTIAGTSTLHNWTTESEIISGFMEVPAEADFDQSKAGLAGVTGGKLNANVQTSIPVVSLKGEYHGMDEVMAQAMNAKEHPKIQYHLTEMTLKDHAAGSPFEFDTKGDLIVNGVTNAITMPVTILCVEGNKMKISGKIPLKMTDFKIQPPTLAILKTGDEVTISFDWIVLKAQPKPQ